MKLTYLLFVYHLIVEIKRIYNNRNKTQIMIQNEFQTVRTRVKVIFLGDTAVGKSSIISSFRDQPFIFNHEPTVGIDFFSKSVIVDNQQYKLQFWDTAGQQRFRSIIPSYIRNSQIGVIVYDVGNIVSFQNIQSWIDIFRQHSTFGSSLIMLANKIDLENRVISTFQGQQKANSHGIPYLQISAKTRQGVCRFDQIIMSILDKSKDKVNRKSTMHLIQVVKQSQKKQIQNAKQQQQCCYI